MDDPLAPDPSNASHLATHQYGTRTRQNSVIRPSARLRQSPEPSPPLRRRKLLPAHTSPSVSSELYPFPPPNVVLHPDDANSKVLLSIGRSFLSVENRAMTIKDLAEMTLVFGLACQNVSAAGQAITTYIRNHMARCDSQGDLPLLLRHVLSGTVADDDLLPALYSRTGGAHCTASAENRATNFRKGTMVWYLSRATGAPCPFARAGISLSKYIDKDSIALANDSMTKRTDRDRHRKQEQCGQKRKRLTRRCVGRSFESESSTEERPPKVKLTLRLPPFASSSAPAPTTSPLRSASLRSRSEESIDLSRVLDPTSQDGSSSEAESDELESDELESDELESDEPDSDSDSMSVDDDSSSASEDESSSSMRLSLLSQSDPNSFRIDMFPHASSPFPHEADRRSPSVAWSFATPPPDSEEDDFVPLDTQRDDSSTGWDSEFDSDIDADGDSTQWESPGPWSPAPPSNIFPEGVVVKQEEAQEALDSWDKLDSTMSDSRVIEPTSEMKMEEFEGRVYQSWPSDWFSRPMFMEPGSGVRVKQEEIEFEAPLTAVFEHDSPSPLSPYSSVSSHSSHFFAPPSRDMLTIRRHSESVWKDVELLGPEHVHANDFDEWQSPPRSGTVRARAKTFPALPSFSPRQAPSPEATTAHFSDSPSSSIPPVALETTPSPQPSPPAIQVERSDIDPEPSSVVVVHTCRPCTPAVTATQIEGISVYQMALGSSPLYRRIDTDFVNLTPIIHYLGISEPPTKSLPNSVVIANSSPYVTGLWVPLLTAQHFATEHPLPSGLVDVFLSDTLFERFPPALQDFHRTNTSARSLNHFGAHFKSTLEHRRTSQLTIRTEFSDQMRDSWERGPVTEWDVEDHMLTTHLSYPSDLNSMIEPALEVDPPLSSTEQEIFQTLCANPDWDEESESLGHAEHPTPSEEEKKLSDAKVVQKPARNVPEIRPLRRSKRVADAIATSGGGSGGSVSGPVTRSRRQGLRKKT